VSKYLREEISMLIELFTFLAGWLQNRADAKVIKKIARGTPEPDPSVISEQVANDRRAQIDLLANRPKPTAAEVESCGGGLHLPGNPPLPSTVCFKDGSRIKVAVEQRCTDRDIQRRARIEADASLAGGEPVKCPLCRGTGSVPKSEKRCPKCGGIGILPVCVSRGEAIERLQTTRQPTEIKT
jgi:ssDNA-binding Zn-finger/Zn-ribbon topoisomerase 1